MREIYTSNESIKFQYAGDGLATTNLPTDLLRTFITAIDMGGYTRAAEILGRSQPAVSLQMQRLEALLGSRLIKQSGRTMKLTEDGKALAVIARQMLRLNDMAVGQFERTRVEDALRIGLPMDFAVQELQQGLTSYARSRQDVRMEIQCDLSRVLLERLHNDEIDMAIALFPGGDQQYLVQQWNEQPVWVAREGLRFAATAPVPLVTHPEGCEYRNRMTAALTAARRDWRIAYSSPGIGGLQRAISDGLGASALTKPTLFTGVRTLTASDGFPPLEPLHVGLFYKHSRLGNMGHAAASQLIDLVNAAGTGALSARPESS
jgi:DNA-binding transcriptional LysR family regulator